MKIETESIRQSKDQFVRDDHGSKETSEQTVLERKKERLPRQEQKEREGLKRMENKSYNRI